MMMPPSTLDGSFLDTGMTGHISTVSPLRIFLDANTPRPAFGIREERRIILVEGVRDFMGVSIANDSKLLNPIQNP
jgi:hypothetical protein